MALSPEKSRETVAAVYRSQSRQVLATLIRVLGDFDLAEEALHEAFASAVEQWPRDGVPNNPLAWLVSAGRFKSVDAIGGILFLDANDLNHAIQLMSKHPGVRLGGPFEIRPASQEINEEIAERVLSTKS